MTEALKNFINENIDLINKNTKESWEEIYEKIYYRIKSEFTETILDAGINDPASILGYIPEGYLSDSNIQNYVIPNNVTSISNSTFENCKSLTSITIPDSVTSIGKEAFSGCSSLTSVVIGSGVTNISQDAFEDCSSLTNVYYQGTVEDWCNILFSSGFANPLGNGANFYVNNQLVTELAIPNGVTRIGKYAFKGCDGLTSITVPNGVTEIGGGAFFGCRGLTSVTIPDSVTSIENGAFLDCISLTSIEIPDSVKWIGYRVFYGCSNLTSVKISDSARMDIQVFAYCKNLKEIQFKGTKKEAIQYGLAERSRSYSGWREYSPIEKIICTDGVIEL